MESRGAFAKNAGKTPKEFADMVAAEFRNEWDALGLQYDHFNPHQRPEASQDSAMALRALPSERLHL